MNGRFAWGARYVIRLRISARDRRSSIQQRARSLESEVAHRKELESVIALAQSQLDVSISRLLAREA